MRELGYIESKNLVIEWRFADGKFERLPGLAADLAQLKVDVIVAAASPAIGAAQKATTTIPIVMATTGDPVGLMSYGYKVTDNYQRAAIYRAVVRWC